MAVTHLLLRLHLRGRDPAPRGALAPVSVLKPLCGLDEGLLENLASFARQEHPAYEVLLGVRSLDDDAVPAAREALRRWPGRFRLVVQRGEPGMNPKVNQLVTLAREARHGVLVVSDSNVRVPPGYLAGIAALLEDPEVGLVTHAIAGVDEERAGSAMDHLHLASAIAAGVVAAKRLAGHDFVVGKSMALRREDLEALGGFESVKDVLAEDWVLGARVGRVLGKRVAVSHAPILNPSARRSVRCFAARYARWAVLQRQAVGEAAYVGQLLLNPTALAAAALVVEPGAATLAFAGAVALAKAVLDGAMAARLRGHGLRLRHLALAPAKDLVLGGAWLWGLLRRDVAWRGNRIVVRRGTRIEPPRPAPAIAGT
ncbi:MAG: ceramide glucosyltransferase [Anaeromyxobacteraceae bacterium]